MTDSYQPIYDAVRSRIRNGDIGDAVTRAIHDANIGHWFMLGGQSFCEVAADMSRPHILLKPNIYPDGSKWCALLGDDLQSGVSGFGDTPAEAAAEFDKAWLKGKTPDAIRRIKQGIDEEDEREEALANGQFGVGA